MFRYVDLSGNVRSINVLQLAGLSADPTVRSILSRVPGPSNVNNFDDGDSEAGRLLNTAGYRFLQTDLNERDSFTGRIDFALTDAHRFDGVFSYFKEIDDRTDLDGVSPSGRWCIPALIRSASPWRGVGRPLEFPERAPRRLQPRPGGVRQRLGL